jgi:hypothetical protein
MDAPFEFILWGKLVEFDPTDVLV